MDGPQALTFAEMQAWAALTGNIVRGDEWAVLWRMDQAYLAAIAAERAEAAERREKGKRAASG